MVRFLLANIKSSMILARHFKKSSGINASTHLFRKISFFRRKKSDTAVLPEQTKSEYEIEYERILEEEQHSSEFGFYDDDPYMDKAAAHVCSFLGISVIVVFFPMMFIYVPDFNGKMTEWKRYEAVNLIEEREARGELPVNMNFVPVELIEKMVPPPGDWEEEWLRAQPSVLPMGTKNSALVKTTKK